MLQILYLSIFCSRLTSCGLHSQGAALVSELRVTSAPVTRNGCKTLNPMESQIAAGQKSQSCAQFSPPVVRGRGRPPKPKPAHPIVEVATIGLDCKNHLTTKTNAQVKGLTLTPTTVLQVIAVKMSMIYNEATSRSPMMMPNRIAQVKLT